MSSLKCTRILLNMHSNSFGDIRGVGKKSPNLSLQPRGFYLLDSGGRGGEVKKVGAGGRVNIAVDGEAVEGAGRGGGLGSGGRGLGGGGR